MLRVAIDVGPTHGRRTGIGNAVAWTVDALADRDDLELRRYVTSAHIRPNPDDAAFNDELKAARADPAKAKPWFREHFNLNGGLLNLRLAAGGQLEDLAATGDAATVQPSGVVQVGNAPGDGIVT